LAPVFTNAAVLYTAGLILAISVPVPHPAEPCREAVRKLMAWLNLCRRPGYPETPVAYCQARKKTLPESFLRAIHQQIVARGESQAPSSARWRGRRVGVVDGTTVSMPDTPLNQARYPQPSEQKKGCAFRS